MTRGAKHASADMLVLATALLGLAARLVQLPPVPPVSVLERPELEVVGVDFACESWWIHFEVRLDPGEEEERAIDRFFWLRDGSHRGARIDVAAQELVLEPGGPGAESEAEVVFVRPFQHVLGTRWIASWSATVDDGAALFVEACALRGGVWSKWVSLGRSGAPLDGESVHATAGLCSDSEGLHFDPAPDETRVRLRARASRAGARVRVRELDVSSVDPGRSERHSPRLTCGLDPGPKQGCLDLALPPDDGRASRSEVHARMRLVEALAKRRGATTTERERAGIAGLDRSPAEVVERLRAIGLPARTEFFAIFHDVADVLNGDCALVVELAPAPRAPFTSSSAARAPFATPTNSRHWVALLGLLPGKRVDVLDPARDGADARFTCSEEELAERWMRTCGAAYVVRSTPK